MLLLGTGHCFRDHVLEVCPEFARFSSDAEGIRKSFEGSSLETIKHMVAAGMGVTLVPRLSVPKDCRRPPATHVKYLPFDGARAHPPRGAGLAAQLHALRGDRRAAQRGACLWVQGCGILELRVDGRGSARQQRIVLGYG